MSAVSVVSFSIVCTCALVLLRKYSQEFAIPLSVVSSVMIMLICVFLINSLFDSIKEVLDDSNIDASNFKLILRALGICYITQLGKDICVDAGESAIGEKVDMFGKILISTMSIPLILQVIDVVKEVLSL